MQELSQNLGIIKQDFIHEYFPVEFYLSVIKPLVLVGAYSSGQFYAKK